MSTVAKPSSSPGFVAPPYPYERLDAFKPLAAGHTGGLVDLSIGTPCDPPPASVLAALASSNSERGYPASVGSIDLRRAFAQWMERRFAVGIEPAHIAACVGTKEFVGTLPQWMKLRRPDRDTVLYPAVAYPTYEMGAILAGCRAVPVPVNTSGGIDLAAIDPADVERALLLWVNSPSNPTGALDDLGGAAMWGRSVGVPVFSDECYAEFTWDGPPQSILQHGSDGVIAVHSLSKRSNLAGLRVGAFAGDPDLVEYLSEVRKHVGMMVPGPAQAAGVAALDDDDHVWSQRATYRRRLTKMADILERWSGRPVGLPAGGFYLWFEVGDAWAFAERLAREGGALISPGDIYGPQGSRFVRVAVVQPDEALDMVGHRLGVR
ncbi:MAG: aminotransferase class I/II-fold pyridoxal phosphate-dependent enzyme [Ilumatobacteraceae bacterium]